MTNVKKNLAVLLFILPLCLFNTSSWAKEAKAAATPAEVIAHLNKAMPFLENGDVANGTTHIRMARNACKTMPHDDAGMKSVLNELTMALIHSKKGHPKPSIEAINKAIAGLKGN